MASGEPARIDLGPSWRAILTGALTGLALQYVLNLLGAAMGLSALDVNGASAAAQVGAATRTFTLATAIVAWFTGGYAAAWAGGCFDRASGFLTGVAVWGLGLIAAILLVGSGTSTVLAPGFGLATRAAIPDDARAAAQAAWAAFATGALACVAAGIGGLSVARRTQRRLEGSQRRPHAGPSFLHARTT